MRERVALVEALTAQTPAALVGALAWVPSVGLILLSMALLPGAASPVRLVASAWFHSGMGCAARVALTLYAVPVAGDAAQFIVVDQIQRAYGTHGAADTSRLLRGNNGHGHGSSPDGTPPSSSTAAGGVP